MDMVTIEEVGAFLEQFNTKVQVFGILFRDDRQKNREALQVLDITPLQRELIVKNLQVQDYVEGPVIDELNRKSEMWVFGKDVKGRDRMYISLSVTRRRGSSSRRRRVIRSVSTRWRTSIGKGMGFLTRTKSSPCGNGMESARQRWRRSWVSGPTSIDSMRWGRCRARATGR